MHLYYLIEAIYTLVAGFKARLMYWKAKAQACRCRSFKT